MKHKDSTRYIFTLLGRDLTSEHLTAVEQIFQDQALTLEHSEQLTNGSVPQRVAQAFYVVGHPDLEDQLRQTCLSFSQKYQIDLTIESAPNGRVKRHLVCFDMDSTLIGQEVIDELAKEAGVGEQVAEITERAMQGELDFQQSFRARVALLKGLDISVLSSIADRLTINEGAVRLISNLKAQGYRTAILSGGFQYFAAYLQQKLGIDEIHANSLDVEEGKVTGTVTGIIVDGTRKAELLTQISEEMKISLSEVIAVGDGANDLPMLALAGLGVAYHAKPLVRQNAQQTLSYVGLDGVLYLVGLTDKQIL